MQWLHLVTTYVRVFPQTAVRDDGSEEWEKVAEHDEGMVDSSGTVLSEEELLVQK